MALLTRRNLLTVAAGTAAGAFVPRQASAETFAGIQADRRTALAFEIKPAPLQALLQSPWQLDPPQRGPLKGANLQVRLIDRFRDDDADGKPSNLGLIRYVVISAAGKHGTTGKTSSLVLGGFRAPARAPNFYKVLREASFRVERTAKTELPEEEQVAEVWNVRDAARSAGLELNLKYTANIVARTWRKEETDGSAAEEPVLARLYKATIATDIVKSVPEGIDRVSEYRFRIEVPELRELFDGSERLVGIAVNPWRMRETFIR